MRKSFLLFFPSTLFFMVSFPAHSQTLVHSRSLSAPHESGNAFQITYGGSMGTGTLANNLLALRLTYPHGSTVSSIVDNLSDSYTLGVGTDSGAGGWVTALYYLAGTRAGIRQITVTFSAAVSDWNASLREYSGVATVSPGDGTCSNSATSVQCSSAITTTTPGDLIVASTSLASASNTLGYNALTSITPGSGFSLDSADTYIDYADEEEVQTTAGSNTPSFTMTGVSGIYNTVAMAFKAAGLGTNPTGMYILHQHHQELNQVSSQVYYFPSSGNLLVASVDDGNDNSAGNSVAVDTCTPSNTWTHRTPTGFDIPQILFVPLLSGSTGMFCTVHSGGPNHSTIVVSYDIVGAAAPPEDVDSIAFHGSGGTLTDAPDVTPTAQPGIAFAVSNTGVGPTTGVIGTGFIFDNTPYAGESDAGQLNNGDGWQHIFYTNTSQIAFGWTQANSIQFLQAFAITFKAAPVSAQPAPPTNLRVTSIQ